mmetsp:Transcript_69654/g.110647  ORF Transcript_69654/g.110647 Transcript_69654/m.110647 type:complete len:207 (-) Transcript_69654:70-690(-)
MDRLVRVPTHNKMNSAEDQMTGLTIRHNRKAVLTVIQTDGEMMVNRQILRVMVKDKIQTINGLPLNPMPRIPTHNKMRSAAEDPITGLTIHLQMDSLNLGHNRKVVLILVAMVSLNLEMVARKIMDITTMANHKIQTIDSLPLKAVPQSLIPLELHMVHLHGVRQEEVAILIPLEFQLVHAQWMRLLFHYQSKERIISIISHLPSI